MTHRLYASLFERLVANTKLDEEQLESTGCWIWTGKVSKRYPTINIRVRGRHRTIKSHRAMLVCMECAEEPSLFIDLYDLYSASELEADHLCANNPLCINPDHLQWLTEDENNHKPTHVDYRVLE